MMGARSRPHPMDSLPAMVAARQRAAIDRAFEQAGAALIVGYPPLERETWGAQQAEALAWAVNDATPTPYLDAIASAEGREPPEFRAATLTKVQAFRAASAYLVARRHRLQALIDAAGEDIDAILLITWEMPL